MLGECSYGEWLPETPTALSLPRETQEHCVSALMTRTAQQLLHVNVYKLMSNSYVLISIIVH